MILYLRGVGECVLIKPDALSQNLCSLEGMIIIIINDPDSVYLLKV